MRAVMVALAACWLTHHKLCSCECLLCHTFHHNTQLASIHASEPTLRSTSHNMWRIAHESTVPLRCVRTRVAHTWGVLTPCFFSDQAQQREGLGAPHAWIRGTPLAHSTTPARITSPHHSVGGRPTITQVHSHGYTLAFHGPTHLPRCAT